MSGCCWCANRYLALASFLHTRFFHMLVFKYTIQFILVLSWVIIQYFNALKNLKIPRGQQDEEKG